MQKTCKKLLIKRFLCAPEYDNKCPQQNKTDKTIKCHSISFLTLRVNILQQSWNSGLNQSCFLAFFLLSLSLIFFLLSLYISFVTFQIFLSLRNYSATLCPAVKIDMQRYAKKIQCRSTKVSTGPLGRGDTP